MNKKFTYIVVLSVVVVFFIGAITLSKQIDRQVSEAGKTKTQAFEIGNAALVSNFPDFPEYPGSEIEWSKREGTVNDFEGHWKIEDIEPYEIVNWYVEQFNSDEDWKIKEPPPDKPTGEMFMLVEKADELYYLTIEKYPDEDHTEIQVEIIPSSLRP